MADDRPRFNRPLQEAVFYRGAFVYRYSGLEHIVAELIHRCTTQTAYAHLEGLPYSWPKKWRRLQALLEIDGPLTPFAEEIRAALVSLSIVERHRHLMVHGMMTLDPFKRNPRELYFVSYDRINGDLGETTLTITIDELDQLVAGMGERIQRFGRLVEALFQKLGLEPIATIEREELEITARPL